MTHDGNLPVPPIAAADRNAIELARVWAAGGKLQVSLATRLWDDPAAWGIMLIDLAKHVASAYQQSEGRDRKEVLARIKAGLDAEWAAATDTPEGNLLN